MRPSTLYIELLHLISRGVDIILSTKRGKLCTIDNLNHILVFTILNFSIHQLINGAGGLDAFADSFTPLSAGSCSSSKQQTASSWPPFFKGVVT
jgi:hypothetical protein